MFQVLAAVLVFIITGPHLFYKNCCASKCVFNCFNKGDLFLDKLFAKTWGCFDHHGYLGIHMSLFLDLPVSSGKFCINETTKYFFVISFSSFQKRIIAMDFFFFFYNSNGFLFNSSYLSMELKDNGSWEAWDNSLGYLNQEDENIIYFLEWGIFCCLRIFTTVLQIMKAWF